MNKLDLQTPTLINPEEILKVRETFILSEIPRVFDIWDYEKKISNEWTDIIFDGFNKLTIEYKSKGKKVIILNEEELDIVLKHITDTLNRSSKVVSLDNMYQDIDIIVEVDETYNSLINKFKLRYHIIHKNACNGKYKSFCIRKNDITTLGTDVLNKLIDPEEILTLNGDVQTKTKSLEEMINTIFSNKEKNNIIISGETGSGKTELQKYIIGHINPEMNIVSIQDTNDIALKELYPQKHITELFQQNNYSMSQAIKSSLRYNPDYIIVSEIRGEEVEEFIEAMGTGHSGITTIHASSCIQTLDRISDLFNKYNTSSPINSEKVARLVDYIIHIDVNYVKIDDHYIKERKISNILKITEGNNGELQYERLLKTH